MSLKPSETYGEIPMKLSKKINFNNIKINVKNTVIKPMIAGITMGVIIFLINYLFKSVINNYILTICNIGIGAIAYLLVVAYLKVLNKEEICALPMGNKIYGVLTKLKIY